MRIILLLAACVTTGCTGGLEFNNRQDMTSAEMIDRSSHLFVGVIEEHALEHWPLFRVKGDWRGTWKVMRRRVRIEGVFRGVETRPFVDIYEIVWTAGATGPWNATQTNARYLFPVRLENGRYHVVRDWWRSIFGIGSGRHRRLPLTDDVPFWERFDLLRAWIQPDYNASFAATYYGTSISRWRTAKILRGLLRYPDEQVRLAACENLVNWGSAQDECWDDLSPQQREDLNQSHNAIRTEDSWRQNRTWEESATRHWQQEFARCCVSSNPNADELRDELRLFTTIHDPRLRRRFCELYQSNFPEDPHHGCPADQPRPATIVTENGDLPLLGKWPS